MTIEKQVRRTRIISSVAATIISLACGTNYVYSAWAPQFADKLLLSTTESNLVGLAGNLGMYSMGVPIGMIIDSRGPRPMVMIGSFLLGAGYWPLHTTYAYSDGKTTISVPLMCLFSFMTGLGGCMAFNASIKTSAMNWPHHRGSATAFPLAAFGLSAFFFSVFGSLFFPGDSGRFLALLAVGTFAMTFIGFFFLRVLPHTHYHAVPTPAADEDLAESQQLHRTTSADSKAARAGRGKPSADEQPGAAAASTAEESTPQDQSMVAGAGDSAGRPSAPSPEIGIIETGVAMPSGDATELDEEDENSSLLSSSSDSSSLTGVILVQNSVDLDRTHRIDIRGVKLLKSMEFWQLFSIMGILSGIGLMTINNIGHDSTALWKYHNGSVDDKTLVLRQQMHVSILSVGSFMGRLLSGVGSDYLVKNLHASRIWCLAIASIIFSIAQILALSITNPHFLAFVSGFSGLGYGFLFGVFPSIVAESFGIHGLSQNWGFMTLSPVISSNVFNLFYGVVYDAHTIVEPDGSRSCDDGIECYRSAYVVTLWACALGIVVTLWVIWHQRKQQLKEAAKSGDQA